MTTTFPKLDSDLRQQRLLPPEARVRMVLDTDTYNEVDDQFALAYSLLSPDRLDVEAVYAAPFHNDRSAGPEDGMRKSYDEIVRFFDLLGRTDKERILTGSTRYLQQADQPQESAAARDLVERARVGEDPLYVVAIGAITNIASAILMDPSLIERIVVLWLGGTDFACASAREFNLQQDPHASRLVFDCGVPLIQFPCRRVVTHLHTTVPELEHYLRGKNALCDTLVDIVADYGRNAFAWSKVIWDVAPVAWLINPAWIPTKLLPSPLLTYELTWAEDPSRHLIRCADFVQRDPIFADLFHKLAAFQA